MSEPEVHRPLVSRRGFLQAAGFALAVAGSGCTRGKPQLLYSAPENERLVGDGGRAEFATTCAGCSAGCGVLAQFRAGRPVKLEGMPDHPVSRGGLCAVGQASILGAFDRQRLAWPVIDEQPVGWDRFDTAVRDAVASANRAGRSVRLLLGTQEASSPSTMAAVRRFLSTCVDGEYGVFDALDISALSEAYDDLLGDGLLPRFHLDRADIVVAFDADFLGTWVSPVEYAAAYTAKRPSLHIQVESRLSLTGSKADHRIVIHPSELSASLRQVLQDLRTLAADGRSTATAHPGPHARLMSRLAGHLWSHRGRALVICGSGTTVDQLVCRQINHVLAAFGRTLELNAASRQRLGSRAAQRKLLDELQARSVGVLLIAGANPLYAAPDAGHWRDVLRDVPTVIAASERLDETAHAATLRCPLPDALASWGDLEPIEGLYCLRQPLIQPGPGQRSLAALLAAWQGEPRQGLELVRAHWLTAIHRPELDGPFDAFWDRAVRVGWIQRSARPREFRPRPVDARHEASVDLSSAAMVLLAYPPVATLDGRHGYNPWLLELPDPLTKVTWGNPASLSPSVAASLGVVDGDVIRIELVDDATQAIELPVVLQPGQHDGVVAVPIGFGQDVSRRFARIDRDGMNASAKGDRPVGVNVAPLMRGAHPPVTIRKTGRVEALARTQVNPVEAADRASSGSGSATTSLIRRVTARDEVDAPPPQRLATTRAWRGLWGEPRGASDFRWGMAIDLDACTGCSACVVACQVENNVPVVGVDEVRRHREMHWLRIDRYYRERASGIEVGHQPMTCHHCGHAPCESVCPVLATTHSRDGLNQQVYSRCVGTRYCMNNCPFKVRRFNWFENWPDETFDEAHLNPEVTIRSRGVVEKCTFCAHRIQDARLAALEQGRDAQDVEVQPACAQSCPAHAIVFGNLADPASEVSVASRGGRAYALLDELNLAPAVTYLAIRTRDAGLDDDADHG